MNDDIYQHLERTERAAPYAGNPYDLPLIPPPPPKPPRRRGKGLWVTLIVSAIVIFCVSGVFFWITTYSAGTAQSTTASTATLPTPADTPTDTPTPAPTMYAGYTASDIIADFIQEGKQLSSVSYGATIWNFTGSLIYTSHIAASSVEWVDKTDTSCNGPCTLGLWVYDDAGTAAQVLTDINSVEHNLASDNQWPAYQQGRCVLMNDTSDGPYVLLIQKYCV